MTSAEIHVLYSDVQAATNNYVNGHPNNRFASGSWWVKIGILMLVSIASYSILLMKGNDGLYWLMGSYVLLFLSLACLVVNVAHDASHNALFRSKKKNKWFSYAWNVLGMSKELWEIKHHHSHHAYTNIAHQDADIAESPLLRFNPKYKYQSHYRYQYLYAPVLYILFGFFVIFVRDFIMWYGKQHAILQLRAKQPAFIYRLIATKCLFVLISLCIPLAMLDYSFMTIFGIYFFSIGLSGSLMLLVLMVPHINRDAVSHDESVRFPDKASWAYHQICSTVDSSPSSYWLGWFTGGLNTHLVHHLYPNICHTHYQGLTLEIKKVLLKQGVPYHVKTFGRSILDHFIFLKEMGRPPLSQKSVYEQRATANAL